MFNTKPKSTHQILAGMNKILTDLENSGQQFQQLKHRNDERMAQLEAEQEDITNELERNATVTEKFRDLLG